MSLIAKYMEARFPEEPFTICNNCQAVITEGNIVLTSKESVRHFSCPECGTKVVDEKFIEEIENHG